MGATMIRDFENDEDAMIEEFLESNKNQVICQFFASGNCRYGD
jgi:hypothetical protein